MANLTGAAAVAVVQGNAPTAILVGIGQQQKWNGDEKRYTEEIEAARLEVVSPATRFQKVAVTVPPAGCDLAGVTDEKLEEIAETGGEFPQVVFDGLIVNLWTRREAKEINISAKANTVRLVDDTSVTASVPEDEAISL